SGGELYRALRAGFAAELVAFSGAGKTDAEIEAAIGAGVGTLILESLAEIPVAETLARRTGRRVPVALRLHPSIDAGTHPYLATGQPETKFGLEEAGLKAALRQLERSETLELVGLHAHIGSQIGSIAPYVHARRVLLDAAEAAREQGHRLRFVDLGGGFAIPYGEEDRAFPLGDLAKAIGEGWPEPLELRIEPGRLLVGDAGLLLVRVLYTKTCGAKEFVIVDAGMSALVRPALYGARHRVLAVEPRRGNPHTVDVVGPICENADVLARNCSLPPTERGDLLAVLDVGAYGFTMASQYNSQPRPAEAIVREGRVHLVRARETYAGLVEGEMEDCAAGPTGGGAEVRVRGRSESAERRSS
ncbi:MAG: diaminopimelate decarboxylase, partial [Candidatus Bipolaricaulia bacterium]